AKRKIAKTSVIAKTATTNAVQKPNQTIAVIAMTIKAAAKMAKAKNVHGAASVVGAAVAVRRQELDLTQRSMARDGVVAAGALIALEKGRRWPRRKTLAKLEQALEWQPGTLAQLREEATESLSNSVGAPLMANAMQLALDTIGNQIAELPAPSNPDYTAGISTVLQELRQLEDLAGGAARTARGSAAIAMSLGKIRKTYDELMRAGAWTLPPKKPQMLPECLPLPSPPPRLTSHWTR
ncbi:MAG: helix-turn-helix domain-containing protein, partial [Mycobacterium sp.]